jgi:hypothetical protein
METAGATQAEQRREISLLFHNINDIAHKAGAWRRGEPVIRFISSNTAQQVIDPSNDY